MHASPSTNGIRRLRPVFIGGCDRSGTTMLGAILGAHHAAACVPESQFLLDLLRAPDEDERPLDAMTAFEQIRSNFRFHLWGLQVQWSDLNEEVGSSHAKLLEALARRYALAHERPDAVVWIDHTPSNTKYASTLLDMFPEARFIHLVRDGRAVSASICPLDWGPNVVTSAAPWWVERVGYGLAAEAKYGPERVMRVRYEDVVLRTAETVRRIADFAGLAFDPVMLEASGFERPLYTPEQHALVGRPPDRARVDAWKTSMTQREIEIFEHLTGDLLVYLGYEPLFGVRAVRPTEWERSSLAIHENVGRFINRIRRGRRIRQARLRVATSGEPRRREAATIASPS